MVSRAVILLSVLFLLISGCADKTTESSAPDKKSDKKAGPTQTTYDRSQDRETGGTLKDKGSTADNGQPDPEPDGEQELARAAVRTYFLMLSSGNYQSALRYHGAGFEVLKGWNPGVTDQRVLLEKGCTMNGLQCLQVKEIDNGKRLAPGEYEFKVQFMNENGSTFMSPVIEGEATGDEGDRSDFTYHARNTGQGYVVEELPPYVS